MIFRFLIIVALASVFFSCETQSDDLLINNLSLDAIEIAAQIAETNLFQETASALKEQHTLLLHDIQNGAVPLAETDLVEFETSNSKAEFLKSRGFDSAERLSVVFTDLERLSNQMIEELNKIRVEIGEEKFSDVLAEIDSAYGHNYKLSAEEALNLQKEH